MPESVASDARRDGVTAADALAPRVDGPIVASGTAVLRSAPLLAAACTALAWTALMRVPAIANLHLLERRAPTGAELAPTTVGEAELAHDTSSLRGLALPDEPTPAPTQPALPTVASGAARVEVEAPPALLVDPEHRGLRGFYRALSATSAKQAGAITRVVHFGDSIVTSDLVSGTLRREFQDRFGDAGHGFLLTAHAWPAYFHNDVELFSSAGWKVSRIVGPKSADGLYGLGGVTFRADPGARARYGTSKLGRRGRHVSRFEIVYLVQPEGGDFSYSVDGGPPVEVSTRGPTQVKTLEVRVPDGEHELEVLTLRGGTRFFGVVLERDEPGVVLDAIGIQGARVRFLDEQDDAHWAETLRWRRPSLLIYEFGANESGDGFVYPMADYHRTLVAVLRQGLEAVPDAGCLVLSAMDRVQIRAGVVATLPVIPALVEEQRRAAAEVGCAFWNTYEAMGGPGSMDTWVKRGLGKSDMTHPSGAGSQLLGRWVFQALMTGYNDWLATGAADGTPSGSAP